MTAKYLILAVVAAGLALPSLALAQGAGGQPAIIKVDEVRTEPLSQTVPVIGRLVARQSGVIAARIDGPVLEVLVHVGDRVDVGDPLVLLDTEELELEKDLRESEVAAAEAALASAQSALTLAQQDLNRLEALKQSNSAAFPKARYDDARVEVVRAQRDVNRARAVLNQTKSQLKIAEVDLDRATIRAPYPGVITVRHIAAGAWLSVGDPVVDMVNDTDLEIEADVPSDRVVGLVPGTPIEMELDDGTRHTAFVRAAVTDENPLTRTRPVRFTPEFGTTEKPLAVNQSATVYLPIGKPRQVVSVHKDAIVNRQGQSLVFVVDGDAASIRTVKLGDAVGGRFEVLDGLSPGDLAVVRGNERLQPGQKIQIDRES